MRGRIGQVRWAQWLGTSRWVMFLLSIAAVIFVRQQLGWRSGELWLVAALMILWMVIGWIWGNLIRRPDPLTSLSILDEKGGWKDQFSSAWVFLTKPGMDPGSPRGEALHLAKARRQLPRALTELKQALPFPDVKWIWLLPVLALLFALSPLLRPAIDSGDVLLTKEMQDSASEQAEKIKQENQRMKDLKDLNPEEEKQMEKLRSDVDSVAEDLRSTEGATAMDVLEALESRASAAERLARKLGVGSDSWASDALLLEMSQHPDTADLALAVKDKRAAVVAHQADEIAEVLRDPELSNETADRLTGALEQSAEKANEEDRKKPVGERVGNASLKMLSHQPQTAAGEFEELAKHFRIIKSREEARKKLEKLADQLRDSGSEISGSKLQKMKKLADTGKKGPPLPKGLKSLDADPLANQMQNLAAPQMSQAGQAESLPRPMDRGTPRDPVPGAGPTQQSEQSAQGGNGKGRKNALSAPIPGQGKKDAKRGDGMALRNGKGEGKGKGQRGMLTAPIPGTPADGSKSQGQGSASAGDGAVASSGAQGGREAGRGTAEMADNPTDTMKAARDSKVVAQNNKTGESATRAVQGQARSEKAQRSRQEIMKDFISVEEQALDGKTLPMSRRNHVLRYFSEIRKQFEKQPTK